MSGAKENLKERQPVVVVMGHVDHGKTSLLDYIRKANVASREAGGITQAVGAYEIEHPSTSSGQAPEIKKITFIDTPGHEAFSNMRSRGAHAADLAILVVAAEEGVKPQTKEAIEILNKTETPFVVAITKVDKPSADIERVKNDLTANNVLLEGYGGSISYQPVSSKTGEGVNELLDLLLLAASMEELTYDPAAPAKGFVLETRTNKNRGMEASVIVQDGVLRRGDDIATPSAKGKVKILEDFLGKAAKDVPAGAPALIVGLETLPQVGEIFITGEEAVGQVLKSRAFAQDDLMVKNSSLAVILKASDAGSLEVLSQIMRALNPEKPLKIMDESVGEVSEGDVKLAVSGGGAIIAFKSKVDKAAKTLAIAQGVTILSSDIVYELVTAIEGLMKSVSGPQVTGELEVLAVFNSAKQDKQVVGGKVVSGIFKKTPFEIKRPAPAPSTAKATEDKETSAGKGDAIIGQGRVINLQVDKKDATQIIEGKEGGLLVGASVTIEKGDRLIIRENK